MVFLFEFGSIMVIIRRTKYDGMYFSIFPKNPSAVVIFFSRFASCTTVSDNDPSNLPLLLLYLIKDHNIYMYI